MILSDLRILEEIEKGTIKIGGKYLNKIEYWDVQSYPLPQDVDFEEVK